LDQAGEGYAETFDELFSLRFGHGFEVHHVKEFIPELVLHLTKALGSILREVERSFVLG